MKLPLFLLAPLLACAPAAPPGSPPALTGRPADLSGDWVSGFDEEPAERIVTVARPCGLTVAHWRLTHQGNSLNGMLLRSAPVQGAPHELPVAEYLSGQVDGPVVSLGAPDRLDTLRYDQASGHLRGSRGGRPTWFAPVHIADPPGCGDALMVPGAFDLSGSWMTGDGAADSPAAEVMIHTSCAHNPAAWVIDQDGDSLRAWSFPESFEQGIARRDSPARIIPATGRVTGYLVTLSDGNDRYELRYDPESGHLRGTRNGRWFWAARQRVVKPSPCPGIP